MGPQSPPLGRVSRRDFMTGAAALGLAATADARLSGPPVVAAAPTGTANAPAAPGSTRGVGFVLSHEQFPAPTLVALVRAAEAIGFNTVWTSDHTQPWMANEAHAVHIAALQKRFDNGATQVYVHSGQFDQYGVIDFYGRYALPQLRASGVLGA